MKEYLSTSLLHLSPYLDKKGIHELTKTNQREFTFDKFKLNNRFMLFNFLKSLDLKLNWIKVLMESKVKKLNNLYKQSKMTEYSHNSVILKKNNEARFNQLWGNFAKS